ncbi:MAG TPA: DoxX family protein [Kineosporiaceae bacterium]
MTVVRRLARPLLAASFISAGVDAVLHPMPRAESLRPLVEQAAPVLNLPADPELLVRANGAVMAGAGASLALGRLPRLSSLALVATLLPTAWIDHAFWHEKDPQARRDRRALFLRDASLLGGALLALVDTEGRPGLAWRGRRAVRQAEQARRRAGRQARWTTREARRSAQRVARSARESVREAAAVPGRH